MNWEEFWLHFIDEQSKKAIVWVLQAYKKYMSYQSLLSAFLDCKYYSEQEIKDLIEANQRNSDVKILSSRQAQGQIYLYCSNKEQASCHFSHVFRIVQEPNHSGKFDLISSSQKHSPECQNLRKNIKIPKKHDSLRNFQTLKNSINHFELHQKITSKQSFDETCSGSPIQKKSIINNINLDEQKPEKTDKKVYTEDQFNLLKKQLEFKSKGFLSRSTEFQLEQSVNTIKKIQFHCKFDNECPYEAMLSLQNSQQKAPQKRKYSLQIINPNHLQQCILDDEVINYNQNTMKIDKQLQVLTRIIQQNSHELKPKDILKKLSQHLGESEEFIYNGLQKKINRRAIKKYFDNCVAKVRAKVFPNLKNQQIDSPKKNKKAKKDQDFCWK